MNTEDRIKMMAKKFNRCARCGCGNYSLEIDKDYNPRHAGLVYVRCTECGNNMNAENIDKLLAKWNADVVKEPDSEESLTDENERLKERNERLVAENERIYKKLEEYRDKRLAAENRKLKETIDGLKEQLDRMWKMNVSLKNLDSDELLNVYDRMKAADEGCRLARHARNQEYESRGDRMFEAECRTWDEKLA